MTCINSIQELKDRIAQNDPQDILLDVRTSQEFAAGHIMGAQNLNISSPDFMNKLDTLDKSKNYITFCLSGNRASLAAMIMSQKGLKVINSKVGFIHWKNSGEPVQD